MSRSQHQKVALASAALGVGAVLALSGCSAGQVTQTSSQVAAVDGASAGTEDISIRNASLTFPEQQPYYPVGSSAPMELVLANDGNTADRLLRVSSPYAESVEVSGFTSLPANSALHASGSPQKDQADKDRREVQITLRNIKREFGPGVTIPVTFVFEKAGATTAQVPIGPDPRARAEGSGQHGE